MPFSLKVKWNDEKTEATITKEEVEKAEAEVKKITDGHKEQLNSKFKEAFAEGRKKGAAEVFEKLDMDDDVEDKDAALDEFNKTYATIKEGQIPDSLKAKLNESELVKGLIRDKEKAEKAAKETKQALETFKEKHLIDSALTALANKGDEDGNQKAINPSAANVFFKDSYKVEVDGETVKVVSKEGTPVLGEDGTTLDLDGVYDKFRAENKYLFQGSDSGGSGNNGDPNPSNVKKLSDLKTDEDKVKFLQDHGREAYQRLVQQSVPSAT